MKPREQQLPRQFEFDESDLADVALTPTQRLFVETRQAEAISALVAIQIDTANPQKFIQDQAYWIGVKDFCQELLNIELE